MQDLEGAMFGAIGRVFGEPAEKAGVANELRGDAMVGMPPLQRRRDHDLRPQPPQRANERLACLLIVGDSSVRQSKILPNRYAEHFRRFLGLTGPDLRRAAGSHLALCEIENA